MTHIPLLRHLARCGKPMIVSTGTANLEEVLHAVDVIVAAGNEQIVLLQCTASYPTPIEAVNARAIVTLREATGRPVGLSDHSRDPVIAPTVATALGACLIEKHFTLSNRLPGPDHQFAVEPAELALLVQSVRAAERALGRGLKEVLAEEQELRAFARRTVFATRHIAPGEMLNADSVAVLRCGKLGQGLEPEQYDAVLGRVAARPIAADSLIRLDDLQ
jgi:sialic acid synthase SpsE